MRNFFLALFLSQGIPMLLMGDEYGHSRKGNNNPFVQDNDLNWFLWQVLEKNKSIFLFVSSLIAFRKKHPVLRKSRFLTSEDIEWHGLTPHHPHWDSASQFLAFTLKGNPSLYVAFNAFGHPVGIALPEGKQWRQIIRTDRDWDEHYLNALDEAPQVEKQIELPPYTAMLCIS